MAHYTINHRYSKISKLEEKLKNSVLYCRIENKPSIINDLQVKVLEIGNRRQELSNNNQSQIILDRNNSKSKNKLKILKKYHYKINLLCQIIPIVLN